MQGFLIALQSSFPSHRIKQQEPLQSHSTFKTGGAAEFYCEVSTITELTTLLGLAWERDIPVTILGGGSHILFSDHGVEGLVIKNNCRRFEMISMQGKIRNRQLDVDRAFVYAESGALTNHIVRSTVDQGFGGLEYALGLPGTIGGAIATNAEYQPQNFRMCDALHKARIVTRKGEIKDVERSYFDGGDNIFFVTGDVLLSAMLVVTPGHKQTLWEKAQEASLARTQVPEQVTAAGVTYRSLKLDKTETMLQQNSLPSIDQLLRHAGIPGREKGEVKISQENPRFLLNKGNATTRDAVALLYEVKKIVKEKYAATLAIQMNEFGV